MSSKSRALVLVLGGAGRGPAASRWVRRGLLGLAVAAGCMVDDADRFNEEAAELACRYNAQDPDRPILSQELAEPVDPSELLHDRAPYGGPNCEQDVLDDLDVCPERCEFDAKKARKCLRRLRRADRRGEYNEGLLAPCLNVYRCDDIDDDIRCELGDGCSVSPRQSAPDAGWLGLLVALVALRRRRSR